MKNQIYYENQNNRIPLKSMPNRLKKSYGYAQTYQNSPKNQHFEDDGKSFKAVFYKPGHPKLKNTESLQDNPPNSSTKTTDNLIINIQKDESSDNDTNHQIEV